MSLTLIDDRQVKNVAALTGIGSAAGATLDTIFPLISTILGNATGSATPSVLMKRDANANVQVNNLIENTTTTVTSGSTTTLTVASAYFQQFTGTTTQTVVLPVATTLAQGQAFSIANRSTGYVTVNLNGGSLLQLMAPNSQAIVTVTNISTSAGTWDVSYGVSGPLPFVQTSVVTDSTTTGSATTLQTSDILDGVVRLTNSSLVSISGIPAGASGQQITIENQTGNPIVINNNDAGATAANRIYTGTGGTVSMSANATYSFVYDTANSRWMLVGGTGSGSGSGSGKNYLSAVTTSQSSTPNVGNGNFESGNTTGFSLGTVGTLTNGIPTGTPTFGSGASGTLSISTVLTGTLSGAYSLSYASSGATLQGNMLASDTFNIDNEDQAKVLTYKFYYKAQSGAANGNFSGTSSNSFAVAAWDVTNSSWLSMAGNFAITQGTGIGLATGTFQTNFNTTQIRFVIYNANASSGAITMYFDDLFVGPQTAPIGAVVTDWQSYNPIITGLGSVTNTSAFWRRVGDSVEIEGFTTSGPSTSGMVTVALPNVTTDSTKLSSSQYTLVGTWANSAGGQAYQSALAIGGGSVVYFAYTGSSGLAPYTGGSNPNTQYSFNAKVPVAGWSSQVQMSNDTDTRVISTKVNLTTSQNIPSFSATQIFYNQIEADSSGSYNPTTGLYTVGVTGFYDVSAILYPNAPFSGTGILYIYKNGSTYAQIIQTPGGWGNGSLDSIPCIAGDTLSIWAFQTSSGTVNVGNSGIFDTATFTRVSGPSVIAASESINARYSNGAGTAIGSSNTLVPFELKDFDSHGAYNPSTGQYKVPVSGKYRVTAVLLNHANLGTDQQTGMFLYKNGAAISVLSYFFGNGNGSGVVSYGLSGSDTVSCIAGDTLSIYASSQTSGVLIANPTGNHLSIERIGN